MIEIIRDHAGRVKRWSSGEMALRWAAAGMLAAQGQFRRVKGYQGAAPSSPWRSSAPPPKGPDCSTCIGCQCLTVGSVMEAPPKSNGKRDILRPTGSFSFPTVPTDLATRYPRSTAREARALFAAFRKVEIRSTI